METYLREINATGLLTAWKEHELACRIKEGDSEARDHMVRANLRLVVKIARTYQGRGLPLADLVAEGNMGLLRAVEAFDPDKDVRFSTYAGYWIKQSIRRGLTNTGRSIRLPEYMAQLVSKWRRAAAWLQTELGRAPSEEEVAGLLGLSRKKLKLIQMGLRVYGAAPQSWRDGEGHPFDDVVAEATTAAPADVLDTRDELQKVLGLVDQLEPREATILRARFGLHGEEPATLNEVGVRLGMTRERVRQIERDALAKLAAQLEQE